MEIVRKVLGYAKENGLYPYEIVNAPIRKGKNIEYVLHLQAVASGWERTQTLLDEVKTIIENNKEK